LGKTTLTSGRAIGFSYVKGPAGNSFRITNFDLKGGQYNMSIPCLHMGELRRALGMIDERGRLLMSAAERPLPADDDVASAPILFRIPARSGKAAP
jgi:hypothetical protein